MVRAPAGLVSDPAEPPQRSAEPGVGQPAESTKTQPGLDGTDRGALRGDALKQQYREQMLTSIGGLSGTIVAAVPTVVFVAANAKLGLRRAIYCAIAAALLLTVYRLIRRQSIQQALSGLFGVAIAAFIAHRTGQARGYFLFGIWTSFLYGGALAVSAIVRRPIAGLFWEFLDPTPQDSRPKGEPDLDEAEGETLVRWYRRPPLLRAYTWATAVGAVVFLARGIVQQTLFHNHATGWLAVARIGMGLPPYLAALAFGVWIVRRARTEIDGRRPEAPLADVLSGDER